MLRLLSIILLVAFVCPKSWASGKNFSIVGSSTVYPFISVVAEKFTKYAQRGKKFNAPVIESTGTGGGFKIFCNTSTSSPAMVTASRKIKNSEEKTCKKNGVGKVIELKIGYDGIVVINSTKNQKLNISREHLMLALADVVPRGDELVKNYYRYWNQIDPSLPKKEILVFGPPPTSGTRDVFAELVLEEKCKNLSQFVRSFPNVKRRKLECRKMRKDKHFIQANENDNLIIKKVTSQPSRWALGIMGYSFLEQNHGQIQGASIDGVEPNADTIADGHYPIARPLYVYVKARQAKENENIRAFLHNLINENAIGVDGYLATNKGLIPMSEQEFDDMRNRLKRIGVF